MKILGIINMTDIIENFFGEIDLDYIRIPTRLRRHLGIISVNTDHYKVETGYDRTHEWMVPWSRMEDDDE